MKANNITVSVPSLGCTRSCPYCISKMTPDVIGVEKFTEARIELALRFAQSMGATSLLITSRGETLKNMDAVRSVMKIARVNFLPAEIQTNGDLDMYVDELALEGLNVYAVSIDNPDQLEQQKKLYESVNANGLILRWTVNLHDGTMRLTAEEWLQIAQEQGVRQLSFRKLTAPSHPVDEKPARWIEKNVHHLDRWMEQLDFLLKDRKVIRSLSFGPKVIEIGAISLTYFPYCIQESGNEEELRSLILREDGHVYTDWNSMASVLF